MPRHVSAAHSDHKVINGAEEGVPSGEEEGDRAATHKSQTKNSNYHIETI